MTALGRIGKVILQAATGQWPALSGGSTNDCPPTPEHGGSAAGRRWSGLGSAQGTRLNRRARHDFQQNLATQIISRTDSYRGD